MSVDYVSKVLTNPVTAQKTRIQCWIGFGDFSLSPVEWSYSSGALSTRESSLHLSRYFSRADDTTVCRKWPGKKCEFWSKRTKSASPYCAGIVDVDTHASESHSIKCLIPLTLGFNRVRFDWNLGIGISWFCYQNWPHFALSSSGSKRLAL